MKSVRKNYDKKSTIFRRKKNTKWAVLIIKAMFLGSKGLISIPGGGSNFDVLLCNKTKKRNLLHRTFIRKPLIWPVFQKLQASLILSFHWKQMLDKKFSFSQAEFVNKLEWRGKLYVHVSKSMYERSVSLVRDQNLKVKIRFSLSRKNLSQKIELTWSLMKVLGAWKSRGGAHFSLFLCSKFGPWTFWAWTIELITWTRKKCSNLSCRLF